MPDDIVGQMIVEPLVVAALHRPEGLASDSDVRMLPRHIPTSDQ
jgi:hypothetical protein